MDTGVWFIICVVLILLFGVCGAVFYDVTHPVEWYLGDTEPLRKDEDDSEN